MSSYSARVPQYIEAYANACSVRSGHSIKFSASIQSPSRRQALLEIFRFDQMQVDDSTYGERADYTYKKDYRNFLRVQPGSSPYYAAHFKPRTFTLPANASQDGCGWPSVVSWSIPTSTAPGAYFGRFTHNKRTTYVLFVVRPNTPRSSIVCQLPVNTYQAYNPFGGHCLYGPPISNGIKNPISFERPCQLWDYILYDSSILSWFERNFSPDYCTNIDLHADAVSLANYDLFVSCGHDEYWTREMRSSIESFGHAGGNVLFLTGNTCYRPVSFEGKDNSQMKRLTLEFNDLGKPEALTTGVNWSAGRWTKPLPKRGYVVRMPDHWAFAGTRLAEGDTFGADEGIIGYETDAAVYDFRGLPASPTPSDFRTLATAELPEWDDWYGRAATMGMFHRDGKGTVFNVATTGWGRGLLSDSGLVHQITTNIVTKLRTRAPFEARGITRTPRRPSRKAV